MTAPQPLLLPALAAVALTRGTDLGMLVAARRGRTLHALTDTGRTLTPSGRVRRTALPLCGRTPRAWRAAHVDGRPLCRTCAAKIYATHNTAALAAAGARVTPVEIAATLLTAQDPATVDAARMLLIESGHTGKAVQLPEGRRVRLTWLVASARDRVTRGPLPMTEADHAWISLVQRAPLGRSRPVIRRVS